ncbi:hypothetical protein [Paludibacterium sp. THUN1379]|uniref:hypothetical protein n=1 Tax=Paludibacterium sp. THUN1379 TaxID=3112107 RepID=UPI0030CD3094
MKQVTCKQMRFISDDALRQVSGGLAASQGVQHRLRRSPNCVAGAYNVHQGYGSGHNAGGYGGDGESDYSAPGGDDDD